RKGEKGDKAAQYLHRGIATRAFERRFTMADHVRVTGATHQDGLLHIELTREVPEALKPRRIAITTGAAFEKDVVDAKAVN
ncbi:MAG: Hsp20 family protein, partial [Pseudomonadota bacterium]|nr:Hsp20 family protein [Pseudomonadota bacterium]